MLTVRSGESKRKAFKINPMYGILEAIWAPFMIPIDNVLPDAKHQFV
jgi:hypothetical protein